MSAQYMEANQQRVAGLQANNEGQRQALEQEKKTYIDRRLRIAQLQGQLSSQKDMLKQTKASIDAAQKNYEGEFQKVMKAAKELNDIRLEAVERRGNVVKLISMVCDNKIDRMKKNLAAIDATSITKIMAEVDELMYEKNSVKAKIIETQKKIGALSYSANWPGF